MKNTIENLKEWVKNHSAEITIAVSMFLIALSTAWLVGVFDYNTENKPETTATVEKAQMKIDVNADDKVNEASTPVIVHVQSADKKEAPIDFYHAVDSGKKTDTLEISPGKYKVNVTGVINSDGSVAKPTKGSKEIAVNVKPADKDDKAESKVNNVNAKLDETIPADKVTAEDVKEIAETTKVAVENGDKSLKGNAGKAILNKVKNNTKANGHLNEEAKAVVAENTEKAKKSADTKAKTTVTPAPAPTPASVNKPVNQKPAEKQKRWVEEKGHYENVTEKVCVTEDVTVVDKPAWDEKVETDDVYYVFSDGHTVYSDAEAEEYEVKMILANTPVSYTFYPIYKTVHHEAVTHVEKKSRCEEKVTGKKWVVDVPGHWE